MKHLTMLLIAVLFFNLNGAVANYTFFPNYGGAAPTEDGILLGDEANDDHIFDNLPLGFSFRFDGVFYNTINLSTNGYISFSSIPGSGSVIVNPLTLTQSSNVISVLGCDLAGKPGSKLIYKATGAAPNRTFVVEWTSYGTYQNTTDDFSFRITLYESEYKIRMTYLNMNGSNTTRECAVGLKTDNADFNNRQTADSWLNTNQGSNLGAVCLLNQNCKPVSGMFFDWTPPGSGGAVCSISPATSYNSPCSFGYWPVGSESSFKTFHVTNTGISNLEITAITPLYNDENYQISIPPLPWSLPPGHTNVIAVLFKPQYSSQIESAIELSGNYQGEKSLQKIYLVGCSYEPYSTINQDFESFVNGLPTGWVEHGNVGVMNNSSLAHSGSRAIAMSGSSPAIRPRLVLPGMNSIANKTIKFWAKDCDGNGNNIANHLNFQLGIMTDPADTTTFAPQGLGFTASSIYSECTMNTSADADGFLAIKLFHTGNNILVLDDLSVTDTNAIASGSLPQSTMLDGNYPNPFNPVTAISYELALAGKVRLTVHNAKGELINTLVNTSQNAGRYSLNFNATALNAGVYFCRLETAGGTQTKKMLLCK